MNSNLSQITFGFSNKNKIFPHFTQLFCSYFRTPFSNSDTVSSCSIIYLKLLHSLHNKILRVSMENAFRKEVLSCFIAGSLQLYVIILYLHYIYAVYVK